ncbi:MAG: LysM peptidoglycan-binding domain-containing protein [Bacteroidia bacterium]|nr:LysM peptidoglycan-binding domain-containing protein [Bacteroidia bacterium]
MKDELVLSGQAEGVESTETTEEKHIRRKVYLAWSGEDVKEKRDILAFILEKAGLEVYPQGNIPLEESEFKDVVIKSLSVTECYIHVLGSTFGSPLASNPEVSLPLYQYEKASQKSRETAGKYKRFVWNLPTENTQIDEKQQDFIQGIQNNLTRDIMFTSVISPAQFVEDIRTSLQEEEQVVSFTKEYDYCFLYNIQDAAECYQIIETASEDHRITTLTVVPENEVDYRSQAIIQIRKSRLAIVYFKECADWAISFTKQVWKLIGGASSNTPILMLGEDEPRRNRFLRFQAPQLQLQVLSKDQFLPTIQKTFEKVYRGQAIVEQTFSPYTGLRPFSEDESIFFKGREKHIDSILRMIERNKFSMVTGSSGDGKSSLIYAGVVPSVKGGFLRSVFSKWAVADFRPERTPLTNLSNALAAALRQRNAEQVETTLSYGFSALVDLYKKSSIYCDITGKDYLEADEEQRRNLRRQAANLLIIVDQFEEFFTNAENYRDSIASPVAQITVNVLIETIRIAHEEDLPIFVVFTMRSDYIGQCVAFRGFAELIGQSTYFVPRLKREEIQEVIEAPARLNGDKLSLRLSQRLLNDLGDGIDQLPVLQHCLHQMWEVAQKEKKEIDLLEYAKVGGLSANKLPKEDQSKFREWFNKLTPETQNLYDKPRLRNILSRHANELYEIAHEYYNKNYTPKADKETITEIVRIAFICLTKIDDNRAVRNRMTLKQIAEIYGGEEADYVIVGHVLNLFRERGNNFIQPYISNDPDSVELRPESVLDITHESLIRNWEKLIEWAEAENKSVQIYNDLKIQLDSWLVNEKSSKYLLSTGPFSYFHAWYEKQRPNPAWVNRYIRPDEMIPYLEPMEQATLYLDDLEEFLRLSKQKIERNRRLVLFAIGVISTLLLISLIATYFASLSRNEALIQKANAERHALIAERQRLIAENKTREAENQRLIAEREKLRAETNFLVAEAQRKIAEGERANAVSQTVIAENQRKIAENERRIAENQRIIAENQTKIADQERMRAEEKEKEALLQQEIATRQRNNAMITQSLFLSDLARQEVKKKNPIVALLLAQQALPKDLSNPDRPYVEESEAALYNAVNAIVNEKPKGVLLGHKNKLIYNAFSPDGKTLVTTSWDKTARLWNVYTGKQISILTGHTHIVDNAYFSARGDLLVTMAEDFSARVWTFPEGKNISTLRGHKNLLTHATISTDGAKILTTSIDKTARIWDTKTGEVTHELVGHSDEVLYGAFSPDGSRIATASKDGTIILWDNSGKQIRQIHAHNAEVVFVVFSFDGKMMASASNDNTARIYNATTGENIFVLKGHKAGVNHVSFSHNNNLAVTASKDSTAKVWDTRTGKELAKLESHSASVYHSVFSPDDKRIATSSDDNTVRLWDGKSFLELAFYAGHTGLGYYAAFSPDSKRLAVASDKFSVKIYEVFPNYQDLLNYADSLKNRELSDEERRKYFVSDNRVRQEVQENKKEDQEKSEESKYYIVQFGETIYSIARKFGITVDDLMNWNKIENDSVVPYQKLRVRK